MRKHIDLEPYFDQETIIKAFESYGCVLKQVGKQPAFLCRSPFSEDRTPSCRIQAINIRDRTGKPYWGFKDFSSGKSGDVFALVMEKQNVDFPTAIWIVIKRIVPGIVSPEYVFQLEQEALERELSLVPKDWGDPDDRSPF